MEDFVPRELAIKLKEKGFKEKCYAYYFPVNNELVYNTNQFRGGILYDNLHSYNSLPNEVLTSDFIDAPTISQVLKWLRENNIHLYTDIDKEGWFFEIKCLKTRVMINTDFFKRHSTCELAALAGIKYVIDNDLI